MSALEQKPEGFVEHEETFDVALHEFDLSGDILGFVGSVLGFAGSFSGKVVGVVAEEEVAHGRESKRGGAECKSERLPAKHAKQVKMEGEDLRFLNHDFRGLRTEKNNRIGASE
jgi:hypothetical protein